MVSSFHPLRPLCAGAQMCLSGTRPKTFPPNLMPSSLPSLSQTRTRRLSSVFLSGAKGKSTQEDLNAQQSKNPKDSTASSSSAPVGGQEEEEVEEDLPWIQEKAIDMVEFTGTVTQAIPGPRVGQSKIPWILAVPLAYVGISFVIAFVKTVRKFTSPKAKKKRLVNKNAILLRSVDELLAKDGKSVDYSVLKGLMQKTGFSMEDILRKYIRYALNEKSFNPDTVMDLIHLRRASMLDDPQVAEVLNEISRRIVKDKGPVVMDISGFTEKGFKRKLALQALFGKIFYLSELPDFCAKDNSLMIKEIFGVTDEDAESLRIHTLDDVESLQKMVDGSNSKESNDESSAS